MKDTKIEWCDSSVNPTGFQCQGCELWRPAQGIKECYAGRFAERIGGVGAFDMPVQMKPGRMAEAARWPDLRGKARPDKPWIPKEYPRIIFIGDMADTFQRGVEFAYLFNEVIANVTSAHGRRHIWMWLTKDAKRLAEFNDYLASMWGGPGNHWPENLWPGVSVTGNATTWRIAHLLKVPAARRFISYEPAWEWVDFRPWIDPCAPDCRREYQDSPLGRGHWHRGVDAPLAIHQITIGGESGAGAAKHGFCVDWARWLIRDCADAGVACFVKQMGALVQMDHCVCGQNSDRHWIGPSVCWNCDGFKRFKAPKGEDWSEWPEDLRVRQFPRL